MLSTIRRALTPSAGQSEDRDSSHMSINTSPKAPSLRDPSPPPFSPIEMSPHGTFPSAAQESNAKYSMLTENHDLSMGFTSDLGSSDHEQEATDDSLLGPVKSGDPATKSHHGNYSLDGASDDHLDIPNDHVQRRASPLPRAEPAPSTSKSQRTPAPSDNHAGLEPGPSSTLQPSTMVTKTNREEVPGSQKDEHVISTSEPASIELQPSSAAAVDDVKPSISSNAEPSKRKHEEDTSATKIKSVKKQRGRPKQEEGSRATKLDAAKDKTSTKQGGSKKTEGDSAATVKKHDATKIDSSTATAKQQHAAKEDASKEVARSKKEQDSTGSSEQKGAIKDEPHKKRGRPKKDEGSPHNGGSQRTSKQDPPAKQGRPKKDAAPQTTEQRSPEKQNSKAGEMPKKRGRPSKEAEPAGAVASAGMPTADAPKKRGRPKKGEGPMQGNEPQVEPTADAEKNGGVPKTNEPEGSSQVETPKKRGRPKTTEQGETIKALTPAKRGRPKKEQATPQGAKPVGIVKKKTGRK